MASRDLVALLSGVPQITPPAALRFVHHDGYTAVLGRSGFSRLMGATRKAMIRGAVTRQQQIEALMAGGTVLPVLPGTRITAAEVPAFVETNRAFLDRATAELAGHVQFQVAVIWDEEEGSLHFGGDSAAAPEVTASTLRDRMTDLLDTVTRDRIDLPRSAETLLNTVVLLPAEAEVRLDAVVEQIDAIWSEGLTIRLVGPSPALSFCSLGIRRVTGAELKAARAAMSLSERALPDEIAAARHQMLKSAAPEMVETLKDAATVVSAASCWQGGMPMLLAYRWREGIAADPTLLKRVA